MEGAFFTAYGVLAGLAIGLGASAIGALAVLGRYGRLKRPRPDQSNIR